MALLISSRSDNADRMFIVAWSTLAIAFFGCLFAAALGAFAPSSREIFLALAFALIAATFVFFIRYAPTATEAVLDSTKSTTNYEALSEVARERGLTARETEIALLVSQGYSAKTIAEMLYVSPETIRTHTKRIYRKLGVHSKDDVIKLANPCKIP